MKFELKCAAGRPVDFTEIRERWGDGWSDLDLGVLGAACAALEQAGAWFRIELAGNVLVTDVAVGLPAVLEVTPAIIDTLNSGLPASIEFFEPVGVGRLDFTPADNKDTVIVMADGAYGGMPLKPVASEHVARDEVVRQLQQLLRSFQSAVGLFPSDEPIRLAADKWIGKFRIA